MPTSPRPADRRVTKSGNTLIPPRQDTVFSRNALAVIDLLKRYCIQWKRLPFGACYSKSERRKGTDVDGSLTEGKWFAEYLEADGGATQVLARYVKQQVGQGMEFSNEIVRAVVSRNGCYYEFREMPEEFSGALGEFTHRFIGFTDALHLLQRLYRLPQGDFRQHVHEVSLFVVYDRFDWSAYQNIYAYHFQRDAHDERLVEEVRGVIRPNHLPRFFKLRLIAQRAPEGLNFACGMMFFIANPGERHLLVEIPYTQGSVSDWIARPLSSQMH